MSGLNEMKKQAIIVAGYYRSGTSALSGSLAEIGVHIKGDTENNESNPKGFFESTELIKLDIRVLESMNACWSDLAPLPTGWIDRADVQLQRSVLAGLCINLFGNAPIVAVKHPHLCRLLPLYVQALSDIGFDAKVIHTHRSPLAIATSQVKKNNLTRAHAVALWASYITSAEYLARGLPRTWVHYSDLLRDANGTVRRALSEINVEVPGNASVGFVSRKLNRSQESGVDGLYRPLVRLVADIEAAIHDQAGDADWDDLRERSTDIGSFIEEIGRSGNRAAPGVGQSMAVSTPAGRGIALARNTKVHPVRPAERGDQVECARVLRLIEQVRRETGTLPTVSLMIAVPEGVSANQFQETVDAINANWHQPDVRICFSVLPQFDVSRAKCTVDLAFGTSQEMVRALFSSMSDAKTDYVAILNAGDRIEPDAIARFVLRAAATGPDMLYCDEIALGPAGAWIRAKPAMSLPRLLESCFVGDWVWYRRGTVSALGGFRSDQFPGAEEQDMQIRMASTGYAIENIADALFVRGQDTRRDDVQIEAAMKSAESSIIDHLSRAGLHGTVKPGSLPGLFAVEFDAQGNRSITLGLLCRPGVGPEIVQGMLNKLMPTLQDNGYRVVFIRHDGLTGPLNDFLATVVDEVEPVHPEISVVHAASHLGGTLRMLMEMNPENHVAIVDPVSAPSSDDIITSLASLLKAYPEAGAIAPLTFFRDSERTPRLRGPLLFGAESRIGALYEAGSPGPGGWLATTQPVDAVDGPLVIVRKGVTFKPDARNWAEICETLLAGQGFDGAPAGAGLSVFWTPRRQIEIAAPGSGPDAEVKATSTIPYRGNHHHPSMTVSGSPLMLEGRSGLVCSDPAVLVTARGLPDDGRALSAVRFARQQNGIQASVANDPIDVLSILRARQQGRRWVRINPQYNLLHPRTGEIIQADVNLWSIAPSLMFRDVTLAARSTIATSGRLVAKLRGMGARDVELRRPKLVRDVWESFSPRFAVNKPAALWVEEHGVNVPWIEQLVKQTCDRIAWTVITGKEHKFASNVVRKPLPVFEEEWARLFQEIGASIFVRPTPGTDWCDDYLVRLGLAAGCCVIAGAEAEIAEDMEPLVHRSLPSGGTGRWVKTILSFAESEPDTVSRDIILDKPECWLTRGDVAWVAPEAGKYCERDAA